MTYQEAKEQFAKERPYLANHDWKIAYYLAEQSLEKQIPKKPLHMHKNYYCPTCKEDGWMLWDDAVPNDMDRYCGKCGQAIDWSDE